MDTSQKIAPVHPGEILQQDVLEPLGLSQSRFASMLGIPANRINAIIRGERSISADTALRLAKCLGSTPEFWMRLQTEYDLQTAKDELDSRIQSEVTVLPSSRTA